MFVTGNIPGLILVTPSLADKVEHSLDPGRDLHGVSWSRIGVPLLTVGQEQISGGGGEGR